MSSGAVCWLSPGCRCTSAWYKNFTPSPPNLGFSGLSSSRPSLKAPAKENQDARVRFKSGHRLCVSCQLQRHSSIVGGHLGAAVG